MAAVTLTAKTRSQVASSTSAGGRNESMIPATFARASTRPPAGGHHRPHALLGGDVGGHRDQVEVGELAGELLEAVGRDVGGHHPRALPGQADGGGGGDAGPGAGHDGGPGGGAGGNERRRAAGGGLGGELAGAGHGGASLHEGKKYTLAANSAARAM